MSRGRGMQICYGAEVGLGRMTAHALGSSKRMPSASSTASPRRYIAAVGSGASRCREAPFIRGFVSFGSVDQETSCLPFQKLPEPCAPVHPGR